MKKKFSPRSRRTYCWKQAGTSQRPRPLRHPPDRANGWRGAGRPESEKGEMNAEKRRNSTQSRAVGLPCWRYMCSTGRKGPASHVTVWKMEFLHMELQGSHEGEGGSDQFF